MEKLGEQCFFYSEKTDKFYKVVDIKGDYISLFGFVVQECELKLFTTTIVAIDPDNSKEYKRVEVYEKIPIGRKRRMTYNLLKQIYNLNVLITLTMSDKYCYKDI